MSKLPAMVAAITALLVLTTPAAALTVTNNDTKEQTLSVLIGEKTTNHVIAAGATLEVACDPECTLGLESSEEEWDVKSTDKVEIKGNEIKRLAQ